MTTADDFERERRYLVRLAYRMLGTVSDAEDVVQECFLRWQASGEPALDSPRAWFTRVCTRLCLDRARAARRRREEYVGEWLPEPLVATSASERRELDETLSMALLLTIQRLRPAERAAFLLHDVFGHSFTEVAEILDLGPAHCRQLAVRARRHLDGDRPPAETDHTAVRRLCDAFFAAIGAGDLAALQSVLAEDVVLHSDGGGKATAARRPVAGAAAVLRFFDRLLVRPSRRLDVRQVWFNGAPGALLYEGERPATAYHFAIENGRIGAIYAQRNPDKLGGFA